LCCSSSEQEPPVTSSACWCKSGNRSLAVRLWASRDASGRWTVCLGIAVETVEGGRAGLYWIAHCKANTIRLLGLQTTKRLPPSYFLKREGPSALRMTWTDEELVARSIGGDSESFNELVLRWERPIYALAYRTIGREEDARDVCQETFLRAFRALPGFRGQAKFSSWLYRIALNLCRDWMRRERRTPIVQPPEDVDVMELAAAAEPSESIEDLVARKDLSRAVERAMTLLPDEQRTAIVLKEYHGLTFQEIAELLGCPLSTVKTRLYQGLTVLRRELAKGEAAKRTKAKL
jgi:RNA polymerase sigma-70 factor, ECF subfamily